VKRVTADSNVLISATLRGGKPRDLLNLTRSGQIDLALSEDICAPPERRDICFTSPLFG